jgi:hypothetical protein
MKMMKMRRSALHAKAEGMNQEVPPIRARFGGSPLILRRTMARLRSKNAQIVKVLKGTIAQSVTAWGKWLNFTMHAVTAMEVDSL